MPTKWPQPGKLGWTLRRFEQATVYAVDPGFKPEGVITISTALPEINYPAEKWQPFMNQTLQAIRSIPGVRFAGATLSIPFAGRFNKNAILAEGHTMKPGESVVAPIMVNVSPGYFEAMGTPLKRGRYFNEHDTSKAPPLAIVDERLAEKLWPGIGSDRQKAVRAMRRTSQRIRPRRNSGRLSA